MMGAKTGGISLQRSASAAIRGADMSKQKVRDLTEGSPFRLMVAFSLPIFLGFILQYLYSVIDTIVVGKYLGVRALAGVGATGGINHLIVGFCNGTCSGFAIPVAIKFGERTMMGFAGSWVPLSGSVLP